MDFGHWTFGKRMALGFGVLLAVLAAMGCVARHGVRMMDETSLSVFGSYERLAAVNGILSALKDTETGQRGYLLTGDESYLQPFKDGKAAASDWMVRLKKMDGSTADMAARLQEVEAKVQSLIALQELRIERRRAESFEAALKAVGSGEGKRRMDELRMLLGNIELIERESLVARKGWMTKVADFLNYAVIGATAFGLLWVVGVWTALQKQLTRKVGSVASDVEGVSLDLKAASVQQAAFSRQTATSLTEVAVTMNELKVSATSIAERASEVGKVAKNAAKTTQGSRETLNQSREAANTMGEEAERVVTQMVDLGRRAQDIGSVLELLKELAEQTQILSINATIEAETAGAEGRRFSVVANEIRRLADRMQGAFSGVRQQIEEVRAASNATVMSTEVAVKAVQNTRRNIDKLERDFRAVEGAVEESLSASVDIGYATKQQATAFAQLEGALSETAQGSRDLEASAQQNLNSATRLAETASALLRLVTKASMLGRSRPGRAGAAV